MGVPIYDQPTVMTRILTQKELSAMFIAITFFTNNSIFATSLSSEKDLIVHMSQALNYKGQPSSPDVKRVQAYKLNADTYSLTIIHDIEV